MKGESVHIKIPLEVGNLFIRSELASPAQYFHLIQNNSVVVKRGSVCMGVFFSCTDTKYSILWAAGIRLACRLMRTSF